jgi:chromosome segregation ATPase
MRSLCRICRRELNQQKTLCPKCEKKLKDKAEEMRKRVEVTKAQINGFMISIKITRERITYLEDHLTKLNLELINLEEKRKGIDEGE